MSKNIELVKEKFLELKNEISALIDKVDTKKQTHLQNYLYFVHYPLFSFTESVIILCENGKPHSAKVLLRSLIETHINVIYHQVADSEHRLAVSAKDGFDTKIKNIRELKEFIRKHPSLKSTDPTNLFSEEWLLKAEQWAEVERRAILKGNGLKENDRDLDLKSKAIKCDEASIKGATEGHFEKMYQVIYRQLSPASHLNVEGIQVFVDKTETGDYLFNDGDDGSVLVAEAVGICVAFTRDLYDNGILTGETTKTAQALENLIRQN